MSFKRLACLCFTVVASVSAMTALAHGPTPKRSTQTIDIAAAPDAVWAVVSGYSRIHEWHPGVTASTTDKGDERGSERTITLASGGDLVENLDVVDGDRKVIAWRLLREDVEVFPTSSYNMRIAVLDGDNGGAKVEWTATFFRGDTHNEPPEHLSDEAAETAVQAFQNAGLDALKAQLEKN